MTHDELAAALRLAADGARPRDITLVLLVARAARAPYHTARAAAAGFRALSGDVAAVVAVWGREGE